MNEHWTPNAEEWKGQDVFLIGGGPSLKGFDFSMLKGRNVIGCNDAFRLGPDIIRYNLFGDAGWWHRFFLEASKSGVQFVTNSSAMFNSDCSFLHRMKRLRDGLCTGDTLAWNFSTGASAINLAISLGATRIFLLGYDLGGSRTESHWHPYNTKPITDYTLKRFGTGFDNVRRALPEGVSVINVTNGESRLTCFPTTTFEDLKKVALYPVPPMHIESYPEVMRLSTL